jgi:tetratricopeptide (TPR) repeat protein
MTAKRFRVAFSYAGEKRAFVASTAGILAGRFGKARVLYDKFHRAEFARRDLGLYLPDLYQRESDLVVVVVCAEYDEKQWTGLEWTAIHDLLSKRRDADVMLCRFDLATVKGVPSTAGYIDLDDEQPTTLAELIVERLRSNGVDVRKRRTIVKTPEVTDIRALVPNNLPRLQSFFGRVDELKKIADALSPSTRTWGVLVDGPGGIGKTSLAVRAAESVPPDLFKSILFITSKERKLTAEGERKLTDFVTPGYLDILNEIARLLKRPGLAKQPEADRARLLIEALASAQALLILDNLESLDKEQQSRLFEFLSQLPPGCKAIATSRRRTDVDARIIRLAKLDQDAALALIQELAVDRPMLEKATGIERVHLYEETGGNPLLLRWTAAQLGKGSCRTIAAALAFLRSAPPENDPLEFIFGDLLETFTENETKVLAALSYFSQPVATDLVAEVATISKTAAQTALGDVSNRALVAPDEEEKRFALVPMVADFLRRKRPQVVAAAGNRLEECAYALIRENGDKPPSIVSLEAAWPTITSALPLFIAGQNDRLQAVCRLLSGFLVDSGRWDQQLSLSQQAEAKAVEALNYEAAGWRAYAAGWIHHSRGEGDEVLACAKRAEAHFAAARAGVREQAAATRLRGLGHDAKGEAREAVAAHREALTLFRSLSHERHSIAGVLFSLAIAEVNSGDLSSAEQHCRESLEIGVSIDEPDTIGWATLGLGLVADRRRNWIEAEQRYREALQLSSRITNKNLIASLHRRLAETLIRLDRRPEALPHAQSAVDICRRLGLPALNRSLGVLQKCQIEATGR